MRRERRPTAGRPTTRRARRAPDAGSRRRRLWSWYAGGSTVVGLGASVLVWGPWGPTSVLVAVALIAGLVLLCVHDDPKEVSFRSLTRWALVVGAAVVAAGGLIASFGFAGVILVVAGLLTSPPVLDRLGPAPAPEVAVRVPDDEPAVAPLPQEAPSALDDAALCQAWRRSFLLLESTTDARAVADLAARRQAYLDELTARHPRGVDRWLASGARAAGNPLPFLADGDGSS